MNLYLRYFDKEVLVTKVEDALGFMNEIPGFEPDDYFVQEFVAYVNSPVQFPILLSSRLRPRIWRNSSVLDRLLLRKVLLR